MTDDAVFIDESVEFDLAVVEYFEAIEPSGATVTTVPRALWREYVDARALYDALKEQIATLRREQL
jgi:hypothetical protein